MEAVSPILELHQTYQLLLNLSGFQADNTRVILMVLMPSLLVNRQWVINTGVKNTGEATHVVFPIALSNVFSVAISVDTPNCIAQTTNVTTTGLDWRLYNTGYSATTVRCIVIGK